MGELYELPEGWEWKKLKDKEVCSLIMGQSPKSDTYNTDGNGMAFFQGKTEFGEIYPTVVKYCTAPKKIAEVGDILLSVRAPVGPTNIANIQCAIGRGLGAIRPNTDNTLTNYLLYFFRNFEVEISQKGKGSTFSAITKTELENTNIPLPPLQEQKRIVSKLNTLFDKIDKSIALHQKNMDEANVFMGSVLNESFQELQTNENVSLKDITSKIGSGSTPRGGQKAYKTEGISLIRSMNVHDDGFREKGLAFIDDEQAKKLDNVTIQENDVLLNITGASVARCCIVDKNYLPARVNQHVSILRLKDEMLPKFLHYYLISPTIKTELLKSSSGGATREAITKTMLEEFQVPVVPLSQQQKTVAYLDKISQKIEKIKSVQKDKMESLVALKASILDQAFRGEL